ncbi:DoxX family protein [Lutibacter citreus]|uniref:DoxX family membrane protein n=1 Tax=Lutibacter citreus TaxID=2138210 RepID=UPI000DBE1821|nr:DoxX family membrane protein [Lutibacter citreus]
MKTNSLKIWNVLKILIAIFMIYAGAQHFIKPTFFMPFVPAFLPLKLAIIYISGAVEIVLGAMLLLKKYAKLGALGIFILLILFLPIHIWDVFSETPAIGSKQAAYIRLPIQFILIYIVWKIKNSISQNKKTV